MLEGNNCGRRNALHIPNFKSNPQNIKYKRISATNSWKELEQMLTPPPDNSELFYVSKWGWKFNVLYKWRKVSPDTSVGWKRREKNKEKKQGYFLIFIRKRPIQYSSLSQRYFTTFSKLYCTADTKISGWRKWEGNIIQTGIFNQTGCMKQQAKGNVAIFLITVQTI